MTRRPDLQHGTSGAGIAGPRRSTDSWRKTAPSGAASWETGRMTEPDRDRDTKGRARQARPRDALGRPLPYGTEGVEPVSEEPLPPEETLTAARGLVAAGRPFSAHEVLEARWKAGPR